MDAITCPVCRSEMDPRGIHGHLRFRHELDSETATRLLSSTFRLVGRNNPCDAGCGNTAEYMIDLETHPVVFVCRNHLTDPFKVSPPEGC